MTTEFLRLTGTTAADRHEVTSEIGNAVSGSGGWIIDHTLSSNIALTIRCSLPSQSLVAFRDRVIAAKIKLDDDSLSRIQATTDGLFAKPTDVTVTLNITFIHDEPDLRRVVPAVPG